MEREAKPMDKTIFERGLDDEFVQELNNLYEDPESYWRRFVDDPDLFLAIRDNYVNLYYRGNSLLRLEWKPDNKRIVGQTHYKYLLKPSRKGSEYVEIKGGNAQLPKKVAELFSTTVTDLNALKRASRVYAGDEKTGVHQIVMQNALVLDLEIAFGGGRSAPRIDLAALQVTAEGATLVFYEAKHFSNPALRSSGDPEVLAQVENYSKLLKEHGQLLQDRYSAVCRNLSDLGGVREATSSAHALREIGEGHLQLRIDPEPRLIVFGFDDDQRKGAVWKKHREKLERRCKVKCWGKAGSVRLDW